MLQEDDDVEEGSDEDAAVDVLFNDDGSRNVPCRCAAAVVADPRIQLSGSCTRAGTKTSLRGKEKGSKG